MKYKMNQISLKPDKYGKHLVIKMVSQYDEDNKWVKHVKIDEDVVAMLKKNFVVED